LFLSGAEIGVECFGRFAEVMGRRQLSLAAM
jgi:hypothetical protein